MAKEVKGELAMPTDLSVYNEHESEYMKKVRENIYKFKVDKGLDNFTSKTLVGEMPGDAKRKPQNVLTQIGALKIIQEMGLLHRYQLASHDGPYVIMECRLMTKEGEVIMQGFGAGSGTNSREINNGLQMAKKRAMVQAVMHLTGLKLKGGTTDMEPEFNEFMSTQGQLDDKKVQHLIDIFNAVKLKKGALDKEKGEYENQDFNNILNEFATFQRQYNIPKLSISLVAKSLSDKDYQYLIDLFNKEAWGDDMETLFSAYNVRDKA